MMHFVFRRKKVVVKLNCTLVCTYHNLGIFMFSADFNRYFKGGILIS